MVAVLLIAGIAMISGGLVAVGFGIPVKEFSFGNTLIFSGTIVACSGMLMLALWVLVRELKNIAAQYAWPNADAPRVGTSIPSAGFGGAPGQASEEIGFRLSRDQRALEQKSAGSPPQSLGLPPWQEDAGPHERGRPNLPAAPELDEPAPIDKPRRNSLFASSSRKERGAARTSDLSAADARPARPTDKLPASEPGEMPRPSFEDAWPRPERSRPPDTPPRRGARAPSRFSEASAGATAAPAYPSAAARNEDRSAVSVLKSGVVDGMAYSLYSDGSIEAQMPEGMMRFASIDELRSHLDQRP